LRSMRLVSMPRWSPRRHSRTGRSNVDRTKVASRYPRKGDGAKEANGAHASSGDIPFSVRRKHPSMKTALVRSCAVMPVKRTMRLADRAGLSIFSLRILIKRCTQLRFTGPKSAQKGE